MRLSVTVLNYPFSQSGPHSLLAGMPFSKPGRVVRVRGLGYWAPLTALWPATDTVRKGICLDKNSNKGAGIFRSGSGLHAGA